MIYIIHGNSKIDVTHCTIEQFKKVIANLDGEFYLRRLVF
jgi:hypothetical protein